MQTHTMGKMDRYKKIISIQSIQEKKRDAQKDTDG